MDSSILILTGSVVSAVLVLAGVIWQTRARPEPLSKVVASQEREISRLNTRINEMQGQIDDLNNRLSTVTRLERDKSRLMAGVALLTNQLTAAGLTPVWELPDDIASKGDTGQHPVVK